MWEWIMRRLTDVLVITILLIIARRFLQSQTCTDSLFSFTLTDVILCFVIITACCILHDISIQKKPARKNLISIVVHFLFFELLTLYGWFVVFIFNRHVRNIKKVQEKTLLNILKAQKDTKYGQEFDFKSIKSLYQFRERHQIVDYSHYKPYIEAAINGEPGVLFHKKVDFVATTSGTTSGKSKLFVKNVMYSLSCVVFGGLLPICVHLRTILRNRKFMYIHQILPKPKESCTESGIRKGPISGMVKKGGFASKFGLVPGPVYQIEQEKESMYLNALFGLKTPDISVLAMTTTSCMLVYFKLIVAEFDNLCNDIEKGQIKDDLDISEDIRANLADYLSPDPERANVLREAFKDGSEGLVMKAWPNCVMVFGMVNSSLLLQAKLVKKLFLGPVIITSSIHISTEGYYGVNLWSPSNCRDTEFVIVPTANFYEFIPEAETETDSPETVLAHEVEIGKTYEMVITNWEGLYRYKTQDLVKITGFYDTAPKYQLLQRVGDILNLVTEKLPETLMERALQSAASSWYSGRIVNYASTENVHVDDARGEISDSRHYVVFVELDTSIKLSQTEKDELDQELIKQVENYGPHRERGSIQPAQIVQVKEGTFQKLADKILQTNPECFSGQLKLPRIIRRRDFLQLLLSLDVNK